jgi:ribosomal protein S18 acetylase RimI-like enzyme
MPAPLLRTVTGAEAERCFAALTLAFGGDPPCRWAWPDPQRYLETFPRYARALGGGALAHSTGHYAEGFSGVALWLPPGVAPDKAALNRVFQETVAKERQGVLSAMAEQIRAFHPREVHWYLPLIGVDPAHQGQGIGSALLSQGLSACDAQKLPAYLQATSPRNVRFYERHGFEALGRIQVGDAAPVVPMWRNAK